LQFSQYGAENGRLVIYFHGAPGAPQECSTFDAEAKRCGVTLISFDRFVVNTTIQGEAYYKLIADAIFKKAAGKKVDVIGFSIGTFIALRTCRYLGESVRNLHLISAAAPLDGGNYLDSMAGKQVFKLAKSFPYLFRLLSYWQGSLALIAPNALFRMLFASAGGNDKILAADHAFKANTTQV
jgi:pimeloyl-ACP methyl ester carboxylesterase